MSTFIAENTEAYDLVELDYQFGSKGVIIFLAHGGGGGGRNGMKDSVKFLIPHWKQQKNC